MAVTTYNIDIETGRGLDISTLYFDEDSEELVKKDWEETNIWLIFERMKNSYKETVIFLNLYNEPSDENEPIVIDFQNKEPNKDFSYILKEMNERVEDCNYYQENLLEFAQKENFGYFVMGELAKLESHNSTIIDIYNSL